MATAQPPQSGAEIDGIFQTSDANNTGETNGIIDADCANEKADTASSTDSEQFPDEEAGPADQFQVPREPDRPERRFREFKGRHIQMMALGISLYVHS
jgi:hypothetical protein